MRIVADGRQQHPSPAEGGCQVARITSSNAVDGAVGIIHLKHADFVHGATPLPAEGHLEVDVADAAFQHQRLGCLPTQDGRIRRSSKQGEVRQAVDVRVVYGLGQQVGIASMRLDVHGTGKVGGASPGDAEGLTALGGVCEQGGRVEGSPRTRPTCSTVHRIGRGGGTRQASGVDGDSGWRCQGSGRHGIARGKGHRLEDLQTTGFAVGSGDDEGVGVVVGEAHGNADRLICPPHRFDRTNGVVGVGEVVGTLFLRDDRETIGILGNNPQGCIHHLPKGGGSGDGCWRCVVGTGGVGGATGAEVISPVEIQRCRRVTAQCFLGAIVKGVVCREDAQQLARCRRCVCRRRLQFRQGVDDREPVALCQGDQVLGGTVDASRVRCIDRRRHVSPRRTRRQVVQFTTTQNDDALVGTGTRTVGVTRFDDLSGNGSRVCPVCLLCQKCSRTRFRNDPRVDDGDRFASSKRFFHNRRSGSGTRQRTV